MQTHVYHGQQAFSHAPTDHTSLILGLARLDPRAAEQALQVALCDSDEQLRRQVPWLFVHLAEGNAVQPLLSRATQEESVVVGDAIADALAEEDIGEFIVESLESTDLRKRVTACKLSAVRPFERVIETGLRGLLEDPEEDVVRAAVRALRQRSRLKHISDLMGELQREGAPKGEPPVGLMRIVKLAAGGRDHPPAPSWFVRGLLRDLSFIEREQAEKILRKGLDAWRQKLGRDARSGEIS